METIITGPIRKANMLLIVVLITGINTFSVTDVLGQSRLRLTNFLEPFHYKTIGVRSKKEPMTPAKKLIGWQNIVKVMFKPQSDRITGTSYRLCKVSRRTLSSELIIGINTLISPFAVAVYPRSYDAFPELTIKLIPANPLY